MTLGNNDNQGVSHGALSGLKVIELGQLIAGPYCGQLLSDMGADVIKVEPPGIGDPLRQWGREGFPLWWSVCARNKHSMTANLRDKSGQELVRSLAKDADVIIENFRPGTMEKWDLGYDRLAEINPGIIMVRISGYGQTGPYADRPGYASVGEAVGGLRYLMGEADRKPSRAGISLGDSLAGLFATVGTLSALHYRERTGEGQVVDAAIYESCLALTEALVPEYVQENHVRERSGSKLPAIAPSNIYDAHDGMVIIGANQDTIFSRLCDAMEKPEMKTDPRYVTHVARGKSQDELDARINDWTKTKTLDELERLLTQHAVPFGRVFKAPDMLTDPHYEARAALVDAPSEKWGTFKMQGVFPKLSKTPGSVRWAGRDTPGADTDRILSETIGLTDDQIAALRENGII